MWQYLESENIWVNCELLHEFLEDYQIKYIDPSTGDIIEVVVSRDRIREWER